MHPRFVTGQWSCASSPLCKWQAHISRMYKFWIFLVCSFGNCTHISRKRIKVKTYSHSVVIWHASCRQVSGLLSGPGIGDTGAVSSSAECRCCGHHQPPPTPPPPPPPGGPPRPGGPGPGGPVSVPLRTPPGAVAFSHRLDSCPWERV